MISRLFAILILLPVSTAWAQDKPRPGLYEITTRMASPDLPGEATTITTQNCVTAEDLEGDLSRVFAALPEGQSCEVGTFEMAGGLINMAITCATPAGDMLVETRGTYESERYSMTSTVTMSAGARALKLDSEIEGKRVGEC